MLVVGYLEDWIDREDGGELAQKLIAFYSTMRNKLIEAQAMQSCEILEQQMALVLSIRGTWQDLELRAASTLEPPSPSPSPQTPKYPGTVSPHENQKVSSWSA